MESILTRLFLAGSIFAVGLGGATTATIIGVANATYKFLIRSDYQISDQARENSELAEKVLREAEATRKAAEVIYAERELLPEPLDDQDGQTEERQTRERPEDRRTWAQSEKPIPSEQLDSFLDRPEPVIPY
jgi:hypothetical protein